MRMNPKQQELESQIRAKKSLIRQLEKEVKELNNQFDAEEKKKMEQALPKESLIREVPYERGSYLDHVVVAIHKQYADTDFGLTYNEGRRQRGWRYLNDIGGKEWDDIRWEWIPVRIK